MSGGTLEECVGAQGGGGGAGELTREGEGHSRTHTPPGQGGEVVWGGEGGALGTEVSGLGG